MEYFLCIVLCKTSQREQWSKMEVFLCAIRCKITLKEIFEQDSSIFVYSSVQNITSTAALNTTFLLTTY
jgi:hypothetical protein